MRNRKPKLISDVVSAAMLAGMLTPLSVLAAPEGGFGWEEVDGKYYWYEEGVKQGLEGRGKEIADPATGEWYWLDSVDGGKMATDKDLYQESKAGQWAESFVEGDWEASTGKWVRYDVDGHMVKGWSEKDGNTYYFDLTYGTMAKGYATIDGQEYYFNTATGVKERELGAIPEGNGWKTVDGVEYWYENGIRQGYSIDASYRGKEIYDPASDAWYWLDNIDEGKKAVSKDVYQESEAGDWAENPDGTGKWVRYDEEGHMVKGWSTNADDTYYFDPVYGTMAKGTVEIEGRFYFFDEKSGIYIGTPNVSYGVGTDYHTQDEIKAYMANSGASTSNRTEMETEPNFSAPYAIGTVKETSLNDALAMLNQIRYIAGLSDVTLYDEYTKLAQSGSFLNAVNRKLTNYPARPSGMSDEIYDDGCRGASASIATMSSWKMSLSDYIILWMRMNNSGTVGPRRAILNPFMKYTGFGYAVSNGVYARMYTLDIFGSATVQGGVAWPAREMPVEYFADDIAWSYAYSLSGLSDITVQLTCQNVGSNQVWNFSDESSDGYFNVDDDCVIFRPEGISIHAGDQYLVTIYQGDTLLANYTVNFL